MIDPYETLVFTWGWVEDGKRGPETTVEISLEETEGGTRLNLVQSVFERIEGRNNHEDGWNSSLNCLEAFLAT